MRTSYLPGRIWLSQDWGFHVAKFHIVVSWLMIYCSPEGGYCCLGGTCYLGF